MFLLRFLIALGLLFSVDLLAQPSPIDSVDLSASFDYTKEEMDQYVDDCYDRLGISDSSSIISKLKGVGIGIDSIIPLLDWDSFAIAVDWNAVLHTVNWQKAPLIFCDMIRLMAENGQSPTDLSDYPPVGTDFKRLFELSSCIKSSSASMAEIMTLFQSMLSIQSGEQETACAAFQRIDFAKVFGGFDWNCFVRQIDITMLINHSIKRFKMDTLEVASFPANDSAMVAMMKRYPIHELVDLDRLVKCLAPGIDRLISPLSEEKGLQYFSSQIFAEEGINLKDFQSMEVLIEISNQVLFYGIEDPQLAKYVIVFTNVAHEAAILTQNFEYVEAYQKLKDVHNLMLHFIHRKLYDNFKHSEELSLFLNKRTSLAYLATFERNMATIAGELGKAKEAEHLFEHSAALFQIALEDEPFDYSISDYLETSLDSQFRECIIKQFYLTPAALDFAKTKVLMGQHPRVVDSLLREGRVVAAIECYQVLIDLLILQSEENNVIPHLFPSHVGAHKIFGLFFLQAAYKNLAQVCKTYGRDTTSKLFVKCITAPRVLEQFQIRQQETLLFNNTAVYYLYLGDMETAVKYFEQAWKNLKILRNLDYVLPVIPGLGTFESEFFNKTSVFTTIIKNIAQSYIKLEDYESAFLFLEDAKIELQKIHEEQRASSKTVAEKIDLTLDLFTLDALMANLYQRKGKSEIARKYLLDNKTIAIETGQAILQFSAFSDLSKFYFQTHQLDSALIYAMTASKIANQLNYERAQAQILLSIGVILQRKNKNKEALTYFDSTEVIADNIGEYDVLKALSFYKGSLYLKQKRLEKALASFEAGIKIIEQSQFLKVPGEHSRQLLINQGFSNYEGAIRTALELKQYDKVFQYIQASKSRTFDEILEKSNLLQRSITPESRAKLSAIQRQIQKAASEGRAKRFRNSLYRELMIIKADIRRNAMNEANIPLLNDSIVSIKEVQQCLQPNQVFIDFFIGEYSKIAVVITKDSLFYRPLNYRQSTEAQLLKLNKLIYDVSDNDKIPAYNILRLDNQINITSKQLFEDLFPYYSELRRRKAINELIIAPDRELYIVPFEVLLKQSIRDSITQDSSNNLMINYYQSATAFVKNHQRIQDRPVVKESLLFVGKSRFDDHKEIQSSNGQLRPRIMAEALDTVFPAMEVILDTETKVENVEKALGRQHRYIYFHTHGLMDAEYPDKNYLALQGGRLYTLNTLDLNLNSEVTVLAACKSGKGKFRRGSGILGFTSAFMAAGSQSVIISLWSPDKRATRILFTQFFKLLKDGAPPKQALQQAKKYLKTVEQGKYESPLYWAPFVLFGG